MRYFTIIFHQTQVDLKQESKRFFLGMAWWILDPLLYILVFYALSLAGLRFGGDNFNGLIAGISLWKLFASSVSSASGSLLGNKGLMNQVALPSWIFPIQSFTLSLFKFLLVLTVLLLYLWLTGTQFSIHALSFPFVFLIYVLFSLGLALIASSLVPFLPDLRFIITNGMMLLFFMSGIFFDITSFPPETQEIFYLNPLAVILTDAKATLTSQQWPMWNRELTILILAILFNLIGLRILHRFNHLYPKLSRG